jgi:hypothetical protein
VLAEDDEYFNFISLSLVVYLVFLYEDDMLLFLSDLSKDYKCVFRFFFLPEP